MLYYNMRKNVTYQQGEHGKSFERRDFYPGDIPAKAGVYIFRDRFSKIIYIGKAANLRKRMSSYFQPSRQKTSDPKLRSLIKSIHTYEFYPVKSESESLILESRLIKEYSPRYNVLMRDDKRFLLVKINTEEQFPSLMLARVRKNDGCRYFGPFPKSGALRKTVDFLVIRHGLRVCRAEIPGEKERKHCLARIVKDCCEPCVQKVTREEYMERVNALMEILDGKVKDIVCEIRTKMAECVEKRQYEKAAEYRDMADNIEEIFGKRNRSFRFAKIAGSHDVEGAMFALQEVLDLSGPPRWIECFDISNIGGSLAVAGMVCFIDGKPANSRYRRFRIRGEVGYSRSVVGEEGEDNELQSPNLRDYPLGKGGDDFAMMEEVVSRRYRRLLGGDGGREVGGDEERRSVVGEEEGEVGGPGGVVKGEAWSILKEEKEDNELKSQNHKITKSRHDQILPDLIMVDGGKGQLGAAIKALKKIGSPFIPILGLAKKNEEIFIPGYDRAIVLDRHDSALKLLQAIRDESHRFAIAYHRQLRNARIEESMLDDIPGIGPERKKALLKGFGSLKKLRKATPEDIIKKVPGIGAKFAEIICRNL